MDKRQTLNIFLFLQARSTIVVEKYKPVYACKTYLCIYEY